MNTRRRKKTSYTFRPLNPSASNCVYRFACTYYDVCFEFRRSKSIFCFHQQICIPFQLGNNSNRKLCYIFNQCVQRVLYGVHKLFWPLIEFIDCSFLNINIFQISFWYAEQFQLCVQHVKVLHKSSNDNRNSQDNNNNNNSSINEP